jgi:hypothetical protein
MRARGPIAVGGLAATACVVVGLAWGLGLIGTTSRSATPPGFIIWSGKSGYVVSDATGHDARRLLAPGVRGAALTFSPDGKRVAYTGPRALILVDLATGKWTRLVEPSGAQRGSPYWSPDGARIAYTADHAQLFVLDVKTGKWTRLIGPSATPYGSVEWSTDGRRLAFVTSPAWCTASTPTPTVYGVDVASGRVKTYLRVRPVADTSISAWTDFWSPSGSGVYYSDQQIGLSCDFGALGSTDLWEAVPGRPRPRLILSDSTGFAAISPAGDRIAYTSGPGDACALRVSDLDGSHSHELAYIPEVSPPVLCVSGGLSFRWLPDGRRLVYGDDKNVLTVDARSTTSTLVFKGPSGNVNCLVAKLCWSNEILAVSKDGRWSIASEIHHDENGGVERTRLYLIGLDGKRVVPIMPPDNRAKTPAVVWLG